MICNFPPYFGGCVFAFLIVICNTKVSGFEVHFKNLSPYKLAPGAFKSGRFQVSLKLPCREEHSVCGIYYWTVICERMCLSKKLITVRLFASFA